MTIAKISLAFVAFGMFFTGYYVGTPGTRSATRSRGTISMSRFPVFAILLFVSWIVVG
jgi:hypothetical protein